MKIRPLAASLLFCLTTPLFAQWSSDPMQNLGVAVKEGDQVQPKIRATPDGGCFISWFDNDPSGNPPFGYDVFLQRLDPNGLPKFPEGGIRLADLGLSSTQDYGLDVDREGNALLCFLDDRRKFNPNVVVTVMKVNASGEQLFGRKGREVARGQAFLGNPKVTATSDGSAVAGWIEDNNLVFQRISRKGWKKWGPAGITIAAPAGLSYALADLHAAEDGSVIASWVSSAGFSGPKHLLANKISASGELLWGEDHVVVFDSGSLQFGNFPPFVTDGSGGAVFGWYQVSPLQSRAQHILADGSEAFPHNGVAGSTDSSHDQVNPSVSYDSLGGDTYLFWDEILEGPLTNEGVSGQKFNFVGAPQWGDFGLIVQPFTSSAVLDVENVFTSAGPLVVWASEAAFGEDMITGAKLAPSGDFLCTPFAVSSILSSKSRLDLTLAPNDSGLLVWSDGRNDGGDIYGQNIKPDCSLGQ